MTINRADRDALRLRAESDRQRSLRRVWPAHRVDDLQPVQPVLRGDGSRTEVLAVPADARSHLPEHRGGQSRAAAQQTQTPRDTVECGGAVRRRSHRAHHGVHQLEQRQRRGQRGHQRISNSRGGTSTGSADSTAAETMVPLPALATYLSNHTATQVNHQSGLVAATISFNLPPGGSLSRASAAIIAQAMRDLGMPARSTAASRVPDRSMPSRCRPCRY